MTDLLARADLLPSLEEIGFATLGYGCTSCVGNSGELTTAAEDLLARHPGMTGAAVLSGNRNFANRIHVKVSANYLASPPLVVAAALAGSVALDLSSDVLGVDMQGREVRLADIWPAPGDAEAILAASKDWPDPAAGLFVDRRWSELPAHRGQRFAWDESSLTIRGPPLSTRLPPGPSCHYAMLLCCCGWETVSRPITSP
ncbi:hypothetical protein E5222_13445 [Alteraurantiacibacter aquimixticola]|uniref:aconitate hydratase n=2 Tax=Alteraurantiacibacter aquimixticola TaxID=2489173 RepID=A0A4T3EYT1_9SPHN|nr:hypothetical protein E5222_13445 [Alteraurantiacibacter aquimixticola]